MRVLRQECKILEERCEFSVTFLLLNCPKVMHEWRHTEQKRSYSARGEFWGLPHANSNPRREGDHFLPARLSVLPKQRNQLN